MKGLLWRHVADARLRFLLLQSSHQDSFELHSLSWEQRGLDKPGKVTAGCGRGRLQGHRRAVGLRWSGYFAILGQVSFLEYAMARGYKCFLWARSSRENWPGVILGPVQLGYLEG